MFLIFHNLSVSLVFSSVQSFSCLWFFTTPWTAAPEASLSILLELSQTHVHQVSDVIQSSHPLSLLLPPSVFPSIRVFSNESILHIRWPFSFSISPSKKYSGLISFRMDLLNLLAIQGTLKSLLQHHTSKTSIIQHIALPIFQLLQSLPSYWGFSDLHVGYFLTANMISNPFQKYKFIQFLKIKNMWSKWHHFFSSSKKNN